MGAGGTGGASGGGGGGWGGAGGGMGTFGNSYGGDLGANGTAGTMSGGAGGDAMSGFGNTAAGGSGRAGISTTPGNTPAGFTSAYGDLRAGGLVSPNSMSARDAREMGLQRQPTITKPQTFSTPIPTTVNPLSPVATPQVFGRLMTPRSQMPERPSFPRAVPGADPGIAHSPYGGYAGGLAPGLGPDPSIGNKGYGLNGQNLSPRGGGNPSPRAGNPQGSLGTNRPARSL